MNKLKALNRREFLRRSSALAAAGAAAPWALNLAAIGEAAAQSAPSDYKALVCVFLYGGNDFGNTYIPYDNASYIAYQGMRQTLATPQDQLTATLLHPRTALADGRQMAFAPQWGSLKNLFDSGHLGVLLNIGTLIQPTTLAQFRAQSVPLPPKLFSHNDQQSVWQSSLAEGATSGWGGRIGDLFLNSNANATFTCINASGNAVFMSGKQAVQYQVSPSGAVAINGIGKPLYGSQACSDALRSLITANRSHLIEQELNRVTSRSINAQGVVSSALASLPPLRTVFDSSNNLAMQLQMVAKLIAARNSLGVRRQVFFVSIGGFDLHDFLPTQHPGLLSSVNSAMSSFFDATVELGVADKVTSFTASDFGRTLVSNGDGSDHGWGSHHVVMGGAVSGARFFGQLPAASTLNGPEDVGQGRLLPSTSVDQLAATLASWMGVSAGDLPILLPNIGNFNNRDLGLFA